MNLFKNPLIKETVTRCGAAALCALLKEIIKMVSEKVTTINSSN